MTDSYRDFAKMIDHSLLPPTITVDQMEAGISLALAYDVASVCIMPYYLKRCAARLAGSTVKASTTIGFPHGVQTSQIKQREAEQAVAEGCQELDLVVNISKVLSGDWDFVSADIQGVTKIAHDAGQTVKVIFENCYLDDSQKIRLCEICNDLNADWVKTSTGFGSGGATFEDLKLMRAHANKDVQVKAAGGIRDFETLKAVRALGVSRCGASRTKDILDECRIELGLDPID